MPRTGLILLLSLILLASTPAWAQDRAQQLYDEALVAYEAQDWETAIEKFGAAYEIAPRPILVYNIAIAHGRNGDLVSALKYAELAALQGLESPESEKNASRIAAWSAVLRARDVDAAEFDAPTVDPPVVVESAPLRASKTGWKVAGIGLLAVGVGAGALATVMEVQLATRVDAFENTSDAERANTILFDEIRPRQRISRISSGVAVGMGILGAAALVYALVPRRDRAGARLEFDGLRVQF